MMFKGEIVFALALCSSNVIAFVPSNKFARNAGIRFGIQHQQQQLLNNGGFVSRRYMTSTSDEDKEEDPLKLSDILAEITDGSSELSSDDIVVNGEGVEEGEEEEDEEEEIIHPDIVPAVEEEEEEIIPAGYSIESSGNVHTLTVNLGYAGNSKPLVFETGKVGRQASGAVMLTRGDTVVYSTACFDDEAREIDFVPLSVEYQERFSSAGTTSGSFNKRDGRPSEHEILTCRIIDRPIRPLIPKGWHHETQLLTWVLSYDGKRSCDPLAVCATSAALSISEIPLSKPIAAVMVGYVNGTFILNPTNKQMENSELELVVAGTSDAILMIEGAANFLPENVILDALEFAHPAIKTICNGFAELSEKIGKEKFVSTLEEIPDGIDDAVQSLLDEKVEELFATRNKDDQSNAMSELTHYVRDTLEEQYPEEQDRKAIQSSLNKLLSKKIYNLAKESSIRVDGRALNQIRDISSEVSVLPRVHGSSVFTRGETQVVATATLGDSGMKQKIEKLDGMNYKRFYLQYTFPPSCVGETGRVGMPGRREVGHGNLAERSLIAAVPDEESFPYTIRVETLITESHGSSSMASVCGGCLALMDAGVPVSRPVAGIAMGMLLDEKTKITDDNAIILSDISGFEDALGTMDFKVAGDRNGISAFQLDIKCEGLTMSTLQRALQQAKEGRLHILDKMEAVLSEHRQELPPTIPRMTTFSIDPDTIGKVIGPGGRQIRAIIEDFDLVNMDVKESGEVQVTSFNTTMMDECVTFVKTLVTQSDRGKRGGGRGGGRGDGDKKRPEYSGPPPEVGQTYKGKIKGIHQFGVFIEILPPVDEESAGLEGLCHVSELHVERVRNCEGFVNSLNVEELEVKLLAINDKGQLKLSRKAVLEERRNGNRQRSNVVKKPVDNVDKKGTNTMLKDEIDVIEKAIETVESMEE